MAKERLQKVLAAAGAGSRRACEQLILDGRVSVNGRVPETMPVLVDAGRDRIEVDGKPVRAERCVYFLLHKPKGVVCTNNDPSGRLRAVDLLGGVRERVYPVGRLDEDATGLLLLTNDGDLAERIMHPRYGVPKTYRAEVSGRVDHETIQQLRGGVRLSEGRTSPADATIVHSDRQISVLEITLRDARNREVRRMLAKVGHNVRKLKRIAIGPLTLGPLPIGAYRPLLPRELERLQRVLKAASLEAENRPAPAAVRKPRKRPAARSRTFRGQSGGKPSRPGGMSSRYSA